ncbi:MAG: T9SS type A sorting domain-containing protein, partial [Polaribacter sp.]
NNYYKKDFNITITELVPVNEFLPSTGNWSSISNWSKNRLPLATDNVNIPSGKTVNVDVSNAVAKDVAVIGLLNINAGKYLYIAGNLTTSGGLVVKSNATSSGSLIVDGTSTGNISYQRYIKSNSSWFVISSPLENQDIDVFANSSALAVGSIGNNRGLSNYNAITQTWGYYQNGTTTSGDFLLGDARAVRLSNSGNVTFIGDLRTTNFTKSVVSNGAGWNLIGNGFPSFLNANDPANSTNNLIDVNFSLLETGYKAIYFWDTNTNTYKPFNNASSGKYVSPGQGFFVKIGTNGNFAFNKNMQTHQTGDLFFKGNKTDNFEINLKLSNGKNLKNTEIKYIKGSTTGLDDGYDAGLFSADTNLDIYTHLVENDSGTKYALQALPNLNHTNMIIPIGVNAKENTAITFSADIVNLPKGIVVYIEDKVADKLIRLDQNSATYQITTAEALNGKGRFFIHTQNQTLSTKDTNINSVLVYTNKNKLNIKGLQEAGAIKMFSILGKQVVYKTLSNNLEHNLDVSKLSKGVYLIEIKTNTQIIKRKVILE